MRIVVHDYAGHPFQVDLSRELASRGHIVWHLYFAGDRGPKGEMMRRENDPAGFQIVPVAINRDYSKSNLISRRNSDVIYGKAAGREIRRLQPDVVLSGNTPLDSQGAIISAARSCGAAFVNWIQDFYSLGIEKVLSAHWLGLGRLVAAWYRRLETGHLARSDAVVLISEDFRRPLAAFAKQPRIVAVIPNWGALAGIPLKPKINDWSREWGLADRFVFLYSGTLAVKHNPNSLTALADAFADRADVTVAVAANGVGFERLAAAQARQPRANLQLMPLQPFGIFPDMLGAADVLVAVLEDDAGEFSVPSKVLSYLCAGRPILLGAPLNNLASRMVEQIEAGLVVQCNDQPALLAAAERLYAEPRMRRAMGDAGRAYAEANFPIARVAEKFEHVLRAAIARN